MKNTFQLKTFRLLITNPVLFIKISSPAIYFVLHKSYTRNVLKLCTVFLFSLFCNTAFTQTCGCSVCPTVLADNATTDFTIFISDDPTIAGYACGLGSSLSAVNLNFDHTYLGDLVIQLTDPANNTITLVGPTGFSSGDGTFDLSFEDGAANGPWVNAGQGSTTGTYEANTGTLASLTGGPCGMWTIQVIDNFVEDVGNMINFSLEFSNGTTVTTPDFICSPNPIPECAATCADAATNSCNVWETGADTFATSYEEIQTNGGESCFTSPIDVSTADVSVTQCWEYTHTTVGSSSFVVLSGTSVVENNNMNGIRECIETIDNIEIFDDACTSLISGGQGTTLTGADVGTTFTVCVTVTAGNGTAEGQCEFQCMVHSVTPQMDICDASYAYSVDDVCSGTAPTFTIDAGCIESATNSLDLDWYIYAPGGVPSEAPIGYDPLNGSAFDNTFPISNADLIFGAGIGAAWSTPICTDVTFDTGVINETCAPITVTYYALAFSYLNDTDGDGTPGEYNASGFCENLRFDVVIYPAPMTVVTTGDAACGTLTAELQAADGTVCESETFICGTNGEALSYDFGHSQTSTALAAAPAGCVLPTNLAGTLSCGDCNTCPDKDFTAPTNACSATTINWTAGANCAVDGPVGDGFVMDLFMYDTDGNGIADPGGAPAGYEGTIDVSSPTHSTGAGPAGTDITVKNPALTDVGFDFTCAAPPSVTLPVNTTCAPVTYTYFLAVFDYANDTDNDGLCGIDTNCREYAPDCTVERYDVIVWPEPLTVVTTGDAACGTLIAELQAADGTVCESETFICGTNGEALSYDFGHSQTATALAAAPAGCVLPTNLAGTLSCGDCIEICPTTLTLSDNPELADTYHADVNIISTSTVTTSSGGSVIYKAGHNIVLDYDPIGTEGFEVKLGAVFEAIIEECSVPITTLSVASTLKKTSTISKERSVEVMKMKQVDIPKSRSQQVGRYSNMRYRENNN